MPATTSSPSRLLIIGASGGTGRELVKQALARGHKVTAFLRPSSKLQESHPNLLIARGDVLNYGEVASAMDGQDDVLCALGHKRWLGPTSILSRGTENMIRAMQAKSVSRLVCATSLGIGDSGGRLGLYYSLFVIPFILPFYFFDKDRQEKIIRSSALDWIIVRPGALTNGPKRGTYKHGPEVGNWISTASISRADVADFMLNQVSDSTYLRASPGLCS